MKPVSHETDPPAVRPAVRHRILLRDGGRNGFERDEKYDDRIAAFADYLPAGNHSYSYLVSASVPGTFSYPSLWASQMYEPAVFGRNATETLVIQ